MHTINPITTATVEEAIYEVALNTLREADFQLAARNFDMPSSGKGVATMERLAA